MRIARKPGKLFAFIDGLKAEEFVEVALGVLVVDVHDGMKFHNATLAQNGPVRKG